MSWCGRYNGELFLGYRDWQGHPDTPQPLFGVFSKKLAERLEAVGESLDALRKLVTDEGTLVPLPSTGAWTGRQTTND